MQHFVAELLLKARYDLFDCIEPKWDNFFIGVNNAAESDDDLVKINNLSVFLLYISTKCSGSY